VATAHDERVLDEPARDWPDVTERDRWAAALADVAQRMQQDRGVADPWRLRVEHGQLVAVFGSGVSVVVAGPGPEVSDPDGLFEEIDSWVAHERSGGPGRVLERDVRRKAEWRARLEAAQPLWQAAIAPVLRDVRSTTSVPFDCRATVREDEVVWPDPFPVGAHSVGMTGVVGGVLGVEHRADDDPAWQPTTRPLDFPELQLEIGTAGTWTTYGVRLVDDVDEAVLDVADFVQDLVIEELLVAWPACARHSHPLAPGSTGAGPVWRCPDDAGVSVPIGRLAELAEPDGSR
jgi:hypothetical protein